MIRLENDYQCTSHDRLHTNVKADSHTNPMIYGVRQDLVPQNITTPIV
jgi:hypothetical protein